MNVGYAGSGHGKERKHGKNAKGTLPKFISFL